MLLIFLTFLMVSSISSTASHTPQLNSSFKFFSNGMPMHFVQPHMRPLKPSNRRLINMQQMHIPAMQQHDQLRPVEHYEVQPNYYNPRNAKGKLTLPQWRMPLMPDSQFERHLVDYSSFNSQIPRPPRLTRTQSENRRRYIETVSEQPRPFNFPLEGPQPSEFKKTKKIKKENKVNNIQDILRQEPSPNVLEYQMPVGIHISGSFKNLQKSGISNVFRRYVQLQPQMAQSQVNYQRVAFDPFYPYKPKSLNDINSLAMKQLGLNRKKKKTKNNVVPGLVFQQTGQMPVSNDYYFDALRVNNSLNAFGAHRNLKHEPFSLNLEVFPIRSGKKAPIVPMTVAPYLTTVHPATQNFEPFYPQMGSPYGMPVEHGASYFNYMNHPQRYKGIQVQSPSLHSSAYQHDKSPLESDRHKKTANKPREKKPKTNSNQLMVHLNVFPSKKENSVPQNHLYDVIQADVHERSSSDNMPVKNETSTYIDCEVGDKSFEDDVNAPETFEYQNAKSNQDSTGRIGTHTPPRFKQPLELISNETLSSFGNGTENAEKFSTFRFPVENLLQFQANDAVI